MGGHFNEQTPGCISSTTQDIQFQQESAYSTTTESHQNYFVSIATPRSFNPHSRRSRIATFSSLRVCHSAQAWWGVGGVRLLGGPCWLLGLVKDGREQSEYRLSSWRIHMVWQGDKTNWAWHPNPTSISWWLSTFFLTRVHPPRYRGPAPSR